MAKNENKKTDTVASNEMAIYELPHLNIQCMQKSYTGCTGHSSVTCNGYLVLATDFIHNNCLFEDDKI